MEILIATFNQAKQKEHQRVLSYLARDKKIKLSLVFPQSLKLKDDFEETGQTFAENSFIKAKYFFEKSGMPTIADDGGLEIPILKGEPGVKSRRWLGYDGTDEELISYTLERLRNFKAKKERKAYLKACVTFYDGKNVIQEIEKIAGYIAGKPSKIRIDDYPFRALFIVTPLEKYYDELTAEEHKQFNHREKALKKLFDKILSLPQNS